MSRGYETLIANGNYEELADVIDNREIEIGGAGNPHIIADAEWPRALHMLSLMAASRLEDARFVWRRIPAAIQGKDAAAREAFRVLQHIWNLQYGAARHRLSQFKWDALCSPIAAHLAAMYESEALQLVGRAYTCIKLPALAEMLGCSTQEAAQRAAENGWRIDGGLVHIEAVQSQSALQISTGTLEKLASYVKHLET